MEPSPPNACLLCGTTNLSTAKSCSVCQAATLETKNHSDGTEVVWTKYQVNQMPGGEFNQKLSSISQSALEFLVLNTQPSFVHIKTEVRHILLHCDEPPNIRIFTRRLTQTRPRADEEMFHAEGTNIGTQERLRRKLREILDNGEVISSEYIPFASYDRLVLDHLVQYSNQSLFSDHILRQTMKEDRSLGQQKHRHLQS